MYSSTPLFLRFVTVAFSPRSSVFFIAINRRDFTGNSCQSGFRVSPRNRLISLLGGHVLVRPSRFPYFLGFTSAW
jgi:hypothetical protein